MNKGWMFLGLWTLALVSGALGCKSTNSTSTSPNDHPTPPAATAPEKAQPMPLEGQELGERTPASLLQGSEQPGIRPPNGPCPFNLAYLFQTVIVFDGVNGVGLRVTPKPADTANLCSAFEQSPLIEITEEDVFLLGVVGDSLLIDQGTGPEFRSLRTFSLSQKKELCTQPYYGQKPIQIDASKAGVSLFTKVEDKKPDCKEEAAWKASGLGVAYLERQNLDLATCALKTTGELSCGPLQ